jgi:chromodomain-helicase-DNA-binding protein 1
MLLVDVHLCGVGNYEKIAKDPKLGLDGKFFLDEPWARSEDAPNKLIPNAVSLINRGDFLLGILRKYAEKKNTDESSLSHKLMKISTPAPFTISA